MTYELHLNLSEFSAEEFAEDDALRPFQDNRLTEAEQARGLPFCGLARLIVDTTPPGEDRSSALRDLLRARDAYLRAGPSS